MNPEKKYWGELMVIPIRFEFLRVNQGLFQFVIFTHGKNSSLHLSTKVLAFLTLMLS